MSETKSLPRKFVMLLEDGFHVVDVVSRALGDQDALISKVSSGIPLNMPNAFPVRVSQNSIKNANVQVKSGVFIAHVQLDKLRISTVYNVAASSGVVYPVFRRRPTEGTTELEMDMEWDPNMIGMRLWYVAVFKQALGQYHYVDSYLCAKSNNGKVYRRPPLPNIYQDGKICIGSVPAASESLALAFEKALEAFNSGRWNTDLLENLTVEVVMSLYSWKSGEQQPPPKDLDWTKIPQCYAINNTFISELKLV
jgi:hypothetical protein